MILCRAVSAFSAWLAFAGAAHAVCSENVVGSTVTVECAPGDGAWLVRNDYNCLANTWEVWGGGGGGPNANPLLGSRDAGGGGAKSVKFNLPLAPGTLVALQAGSGGTTGACSNILHATRGLDSWFHGTGLSAAAVSAQGGGFPDLRDGGAASLGIGDLKYSGGRGGAGLAFAGPGGGAAGGPSADGANGGDAAGTTPGVGGIGVGDSGSGGTGGVEGAVGVNGSPFGGGGGAGGYCVAGSNGAGGRIRGTWVQANNCGGGGGIIFHAPF